MTRILRVVFLALATVVFVGCNNGGADGSQTLIGRVQGGQQPVSGSTVTLYAAGSGLNSASVLATGTTDTNGNFTLTSYTCPASNTQTYIVASGGNPGVGANIAIHMMAALGNCGTIPGFVNIDEVTTVAAAYALNGFIGPNGCVDCASGLPTDVENVHSSASNTLGLSNAMLTAARLASVESGSASPPLPSVSACGTSTPPVNCGAEERLDSLANSLAACVNTSNISSITSSQCIELFDCATPGAGFSSGSCSYSHTPASDTLQAILYIARNPGQVSMAGVYDVATKNVVFPLALTGAPTDWTLALNVTGGGLNEPQVIVIDASGNVWVGNTAVGANSISEFNSSGVAAIGSPFTGGGLSTPGGAAIDASGNVWVTNTAVGANSISEFNSSGVAAIGSPFTGGGLDNPKDIAINVNGDIWVSNYSGSSSSISEFNSSGVAAIGSPFTGGGLSDPGLMAIDASEDIWVVNHLAISISEFNSSGIAVTGSPYTGGGLNSPQAIAIDASGDIWVTNNSAGSGISISEFDSSGAAVPGSPFTGGGIYGPLGIAIDASGDIWVANNSANLISELNSSGVALSPNVGFTGGGLNSAVAIAVDASGDIWVTNSFGNSLTEFIGAAAPTRTPLVDTLTQGFTP